MTVRITVFRHRVANRLFKRTGQSVVRNGFGRSTKRIAYINVQQQMSGNAHTPHGGNARDLLAYTRPTESDTYKNFFMAAPLLLGGISLWRELRSDNERKETEQERMESEKKKIEIKQEQREIESEKARQDNARQMSVEWSSMHPSRKAVLNKRNRNNLFSTLRKLLGMANNSKADETTPVPDDVADVINFFLLWKNHRDDDTIDSTRLKKYIKSEFRAFRDTLKDIRDDEARDWDEADSDILNEVVDFLDDISKMETKGSGES